MPVAVQTLRRAAFQRKGGVFVGWRWLLVALLGHGLLLPWLGFYWDDWTPLLVALMPQTTWRDFMAAFAQNRPLSGLLFWLLMHLLGPRPWAWHLFILGLRALAAGLVARLVTRLWPQRSGLAWWTGVFLALYPAFRLQPMAVAFTPHLLSMALSLASLLAFWEGWQARGRRRWYLWIASWGAMLLSLFLLEYYIGLEALRMLGLLVLARRARSREDRQQVLAYALPYLGLLALGIWGVRVWSRPPEPGVGWQMLRQRPGLYPYTVLYLLLQGWFPERFFDPRLWKDLGEFVWLALTGLVALGVAWVILWMRPKASVQRVPEATGPGFSVWLVALLAIAAGVLPLWVNGRVAGTLYADRFLLPALPGAALLWAALLETASCAPRLQRGIAYTLVYLAAWTLLFNGLSFVRSWRQLRWIYQQLWWRAPYVVPGTPFLGEGAQTLYIAEYVVGETLNALYRDAQREPHRLAYWFYPVGTMAQATRGQVLMKQHKIWRFEGRLTDAVLFLSRKARSGQRCVWVLTPDEVNNPYIPEEIRPLVPFSNPSRIQTTPAAQPPVFFGFVRQAQTWCYFYEKAELARQMGRWQDVTRLWQEAQQAQVAPKHVYELRPFILAFGHLGEWEQALALSVQVWENVGQGGQDEALIYLCDTWARLRADTPPHPRREQAWRELETRLGGCPTR